MPFTLLPVHELFVTFFTLVGQFSVMYAFYVVLQVFVCVCSKLITMWTC